MGQITFQIEVINVSAPSFTKTPKGGYNQIEVAFKRSVEGKMKVDGKKLIDFKYPDVYKFCAGLKGGEKVTVVSEKNDGDKFWNWTSAELAGNDGAAAPAEKDTGGNQGAIRESVDKSGNDSGSEKTTSTRSRVTGSTYETPAERAQKQVYIVRQSSITAALELLKANTTPCEASNGGQYIPITKEQVVETAKFFEAYVFEKDATKNSVADIASDIPF